MPCSTRILIPAMKRFVMSSPAIYAAALAIRILSTRAQTHLPLAVVEFRYAGEATAYDVADDRYIAEDSLDLIYVEYEPLSGVHNLDVASSGDAPLVHADVPGNVAAPLVQAVGDPD